MMLRCRRLLRYCTRGEIQEYKWRLFIGKFISMSGLKMWKNLSEEERGILKR